MKIIKSRFPEFSQELYRGIYNGLSGLVMQPYRGLQKSGGQGLAEGVGKGVGGALLKPTAGKILSHAIEKILNRLSLGLFGLAGFPLDGLHKWVRRSLSISKSKEIIKSRITQGIEEMVTASNEEQKKVVQRWHELHNGAA